MNIYEINSHTNFRNFKLLHLKNVDHLIFREVYLDPLNLKKILKYPYYFRGTEITIIESDLIDIYYWPEIITLKKVFLRNTEQDELLRFRKYGSWAPITSYELLGI